MDCWLTYISWIDVGRLLVANNNDKTTINMARNPKAKDNLRPFPKGVSGNPEGRPKSLAKVIKGMPDDAKSEIYGVLHRAISLSCYEDAKTYIDQVTNDKRLGKYGFIFQVALKSLSGPLAWFTLNDILDRLIGKPRVQAELRMRQPRNYIVIDGPDVGNKIKPGDFVVHVTSREEAEMIMNIGNPDV